MEETKRRREVFKGVPVVKCAALRCGEGGMGSPLNISSHIRPKRSAITANFTPLDTSEFDPWIYENEKSENFSGTRLGGISANPRPSIKAEEGAEGENSVGITMGTRVQRF
ncbi:hypothetical protein J6590_024147 [Homalodisca vitripennis]|nr:hypothetical protein J6590_024147 [Homalodisca vitripennis]